MVKGNPKSSASSATRKKHLKKHAQPDDQVPKEKKPKVKGEKGKKKSEPRVKMFIPPVKPAPLQPDPLETTGLAHSLPADLLIILRNISKKAQVTKTRALEELQSAWVNQCLKEGRDSLLTYTLVEMLPVWFHHISSLFVSPSRRIRLLATSLHSSLLQIPPVREQMVFFLRETANASQLEDILGTWCLAIHDIDRSVSSTASKSWTDIVVTTSPSPTQFLLNPDILVSLNSFVERVVLDPSGVYLYLNPLPPPPPPPSAVAKKGAGRGPSVATPRKDDGDQTPRSKQEENEESEQDRRARLRIAGLGALRWLLVGGSTTFSEEVQSFYSNPVLWSILQPNESCPWVEVESFGFGQPNVRKSGWGLLQTLLTTHKDHLESLVPTLGTAVLRSAWVETDSNVHGAMWQPLLVFLKQFPQSWVMDENRKENDSDSDAESETDGPSAKTAGEKPCLAYQEFLQFLQSGCSGSPTQGYPAVVIIISTIPPSILNSASDSPLSHLFSSFWEASESRALSSLHRMVASSAFLSSLLECLVFLVKRMRTDHTRASETEGTSTHQSKVVVHQQFSILWDQLTSQKLKVEERAAARLIAQTLEALFHVDPDLCQDGWDVILQGMKSSSERGDSVQLISAILKVFYDRFKKETALKTKSEDMLKEILKDALDRCKKVLIRSEGDGDAKAALDLLLNILDQFREGLFFDSTLSDELDSLLCRYPTRVLSISHGLFLSYLVHRKDERKGSEVWHSLLSAIAAEPADGRILEENSIGRLLEAAQKGQLPKYLKPQGGELDALVGSLLEKALNEPVGSKNLSLLRNVLLSSEYFISKSGFDTILEIIVATFSSSVNKVIIGGDNDTPSDSETATNLVQSVFVDVKQHSRLLMSLIPNLFLLAYLIPSIGANGTDLELSPSQTIARTLWEEWIRDSTDVEKTGILALTKNRLKDILQDTEMVPIPEDIFAMASEKPPGFQLDYLEDLFPSRPDLDAMLIALATDPIDPSISVLDPLTPSTQGTRHSVQPSKTDYRGFSAYARIISGLLHLFTEERWLAKRNMWAVRHFYALSVYAQDLLAVPSAVSRCPVFNDKVTPGALNHVVERARQVSVYLLNSMESQEGENWKRPVLDRYMNQREAVDDLTQLQTFLFELIAHAKERDSILDTRVLKMVLDSLLADGIDAGEADIWIQVARKLEKAAPQTSITIVAVVTSTGAEPPKLDRYRNELAAGLLGIKPRQANVDGLLNLRKLYATAPDPNGDVIFLPPPRAINVVKACQSWVLSESDDDDELDEEVQSAMLPIFMHLAPILQNVPGSHWAFIFDVLEAVLEFSSDEDEGETASEEGYKLVGLSRALKLVVSLEDLAKRNKSLMAEWAERRIGVFTTIRDLSVISSDPVELSSIPRSTCRELVLSIVQDLPPSLLDQDTLSKMCHLIDDPSYVVQKMAYQLLKAAARKRTEYFVIEAGVDTESVVQAVLPAELLDIILRQMDFGEHGSGDEEEAGEQTQNIFGYLLGWMLVFDLFQDASFKVKSSYIDQLKSLNAVVDHFIPCFLGLLRLDRGGLSKAFKLDIWAIDQFFVELYKPGNPHTIPVLAAHVYYRALLTTPSLIHSWMLDCKDRQLSNTVTTYTSTHFSPVLIRAELEHVRTHATADGLADDSMSIKVATAVNEVVAAYLVDEHQLEIKLRIPSDWPLHKIEVRDVKRVGVDENRWRAWVLGVQQTIWAQNGRIIDGLGLFKKNVTLHFEGQVECAICYSIISVMDGSLPKKPCKTCKNRFHAGCLYKWFNSSHSSSCPLCRSDII